MSVPAVWHLVTGEYPPQPGGVGDYTARLAAELAAAGDEIHVWCPALPGPPPSAPGVTVHPILGRLGPGAWRRLGRALDRFPPGGRLLVQWVPHAFGLEGLNLPFGGWLLGRAARRRERVEVMFHEVYVPFAWRWRQAALAAGQRLLTLLVARAARRAWVSIPAWEACLRPYASRRLAVTWLPVPSNVPVADDPRAVAAVRARYAPDGGPLVGHFGTAGPPIMGLLRPAVVGLSKERPDLRVLLIGSGGPAARATILRHHPELADRLAATGPLTAAGISHHLLACSVLLQPYPDGVSTRRTTAMAALAHARPLLATTGPLTEPLWAEHQAAALATDPAGLIAATRRLLDDPTARAALAASGAALYRARFDWPHVVTALRGGAS